MTVLGCIEVTQTRKEMHVNRTPRNSSSRRKSRNTNASGERCQCNLAPFEASMSYGDDVE